VVKVVNKDTLIYDVVLEHPEAEEVFRKHGIRCSG
jgi:iron-sulfur cluster repair protein YtfE (RIC family)